ncbi:hypothetical protein RJ639_042117 [Escallonia herrerae]|uniref:Matrin-type domain-containing protein n=1 Tax=Escallonia herrerae TaxID=1293975 RepID=A0AA89B1L3_9ASTE|nr:hypothetical protein RJ639_042117 [Escallonia herrerae]
MTEYWVSQGNKWCDFCKIFISNNPASIRNHELGQRHKDSVAKRLVTMREEKAAKQKEQEAAVRVLEQIEKVSTAFALHKALSPLIGIPVIEKAKHSYQKDISTFQEARESNANALVAQEDGQGTAMFGGEWEHDSSSGYYYNQSNGCYYDPNSGFYYTDALGKWVTQEEALAASQVPSDSILKKPTFKKPISASEAGPPSESKKPSPVSASANPKRSMKGAPSSLTVNKRKRQFEKPKVVPKEEAAAVKAREAARKRVEAREKPLLGLYRN